MYIFLSKVNKLRMKSCLLVLIVLILIQSTIGYLIPKVAVKVLKPNGLQMLLMQGCVAEVDAF